MPILQKGWCFANGFILAHQEGSYFHHASEDLTGESGVEISYHTNPKLECTKTWLGKMGSQTQYRTILQLSEKHKKIILALEKVTWESPFGEFRPPKKFRVRPLLELLFLFSLSHKIWSKNWFVNCFQKSNFCYLIWLLWKLPSIINEVFVSWIKLELQRIGEKRKLY